MFDVVLASTNPGKVREISALLDSTVVRVLPRPAEVPDVVEDAGTYLGNAMLKADALCAATGLPALADDSGVEVLALGAFPGVETAHFGGPGLADVERVEALLAHCRELTDRRTRFVTVVVLAMPDGRHFVGEGEVLGQLARERRGPNGFGHDPIFIPDELDGLRTFGEASDEDKASLSHRARAVRALVEGCDLLR
jgi:XTP/dITP diphosphohydrolase